MERCTFGFSAGVVEKQRQQAAADFCRREMDFLNKCDIKEEFILCVTPTSY